MSNALRSIVALLPAVAALGAPSPAPAAWEDPAARDYHRVLLRHTRWVESTYDEAAGVYAPGPLTSGVASVLGNAVLLRFGRYDAELAGVDRATLREHTVRTIEHYTARNRWVDPGGTWGGRIFWDSTYESYFTAAAKLLWDELDAATRTGVDRIVAGEADYMASLEDREDPLSGGWSSNGLLGGFRGDSKLEEMGAKSMPLAAGLAHLPDAPSAGTWRQWLNRWTTNLGGLPPADEANTALIDGRTVAEWNTAQNVFDSFLVENHGSFAPHYQQAIGAYAGRNAAHFLIAGRPLPDALRAVPNADELWATLARLGTDAGVSAHPMVGDRHHLYGRDALPLAHRAMVLGDRYAARAERMLLDRLGPYQAYPPSDRVTKFSGEPHYEPEARAELAIAYLLHIWRDRLAGDVEPVSEAELFARFSGATDFGADPGLAALQSPGALAIASTKPGLVKLAWAPQHDDWLFDVAGPARSLLPTTALTVTGRTVREYLPARDGFDGLGVLLTTPAGRAGFAALPTGDAVYATSGLGEGEGALRLHNIAMPGVAGLDGDRTFSTAEGDVTLAPAPDLGDGGEDVVRFPAVTARYVRFIGAELGSRFGYSLWDFEVRAGDGPDLARGRPTTATSVFAPGFEPWRATDGDPATRWAVARAERPRVDSWLAVDLGQAHMFDRVRLRFDPAYARAYRIEVSDDGVTWREAATVPESRSIRSPWLNVDGRAGFVIRGSENPIRVSAEAVTLSSGPATGSAGMIVEARPAESPQATAAAAQVPAPTGGPAGLRASRAGGFLSVFNIGSEAVSGAALELPQRGATVLYEGVQYVQPGRTIYEPSLAAGDVRIEPPRFTLSSDDGPMPALRVEVLDSATVEVSNLEPVGIARVRLRGREPGGPGPDSRIVTLPAGETRTVRFPPHDVTPTPDLARARTTFPSSPLPAGMTDPEFAVDGDERTAWRAAPGGRMVVDLGASRTLAVAHLRWTEQDAPKLRIELSDDGLTYTRVADADARGSSGTVDLGGAGARYVALTVDDRRDRDAALESLELFASQTDATRTHEARR